MNRNDLRNICEQILPKNRVKANLLGNGQNSERGLGRLSRLSRICFKIIRVNPLNSPNPRSKKVGFCFP